jgi:uncharacterized protein DUF4406
VVSLAVDLPIPPFVGAKAYLAGPMRGIEEYNFHAFGRATAVLRHVGWDVWSPAEHDESEGFNQKTDEAQPLAYYMERDLPPLCRSDAVIVLPGWEESVGASLEVHTAHVCEIPVYEYEGGGLVEGDGPSSPSASPLIRQFDTGATRNTNEDKLAYEGFFSPLVFQERARYMHRHRVQPDGNLRAPDNWQKGIPLETYIDSGWRHMMDWWLNHRGYESRESIQEALCALAFNVEGYLHEVLKVENECRT